MFPHPTPPTSGGLSGRKRENVTRATSNLCLRCLMFMSHFSAGSQKYCFGGDICSGLITLFQRAGIKETASNRPGARAQMLELISHPASREGVGTTRRSPDASRLSLLAGFARGRKDGGSVSGPSPPLEGTCPGKSARRKSYLRAPFRRPPPS